MAWIAWAKVYEPNTKRWYCLSCGKRTKIECNPLWLADGRPRTWDDANRYDYITRCDCCKYQHSIGGYNCPNCGCHSEEEPLKIENHRYNSYYSYEFGVTGYDWEEQHQCPKCRSKYWISNSSC